MLRAIADSKKKTIGSTAARLQIVSAATSRLNAICFSTEIRDRRRTLRYDLRSYARWIR